MAQEVILYNDACYCKAQLLHTLAKFVHVEAKPAETDKLLRSATSKARHILTHLPVGTELTAVCWNENLDIVAPVKGIVSAPETSESKAVECCSNPSHDPHPVENWPAACVGVSARSYDDQQEPDAKHTQSKINITQLPVSFVDDHVIDTPARKELLKQHLNTNIALEDVQCYLKTTLVQLEHVEYHLLACHHCNEMPWPDAQEKTELSRLICCSGCPASFHADCLEHYGMKSPCEYVNMVTRPDRPHSGCGDIWLCPLCCERLAPLAAEPFEQGDASTQSSQAPPSNLTKALMVDSAADASIVTMSEWRETFWRDYPGYRSYYPKLIAKEASYRQWLERLGLQLPGWLKPLPAAGHAALGSAHSLRVSQAVKQAGPSASTGSAVIPVQQQPSRHVALSQPEHESANEATAGRTRVAPPHHQPAGHLVASPLKRQSTQADTNPAKRVCTAVPSISELRLWPLVQELLVAFKPLMQVKSGVSGTSCSNSHLDDFDLAAAMLLQKAWGLKAASLSQAVADAIKAEADDMKAHGDSCKCGGILATAALRLQGAMTRCRGPIAAAEISALALLCSDSMAGIKTEEGTTLMYAWRILTALVASQPLLAEVVTNAGADSSTSTTNALDDRLPIFQDAIATLLAALLSQTGIPDS